MQREDVVSSQNAKCRPPKEAANPEEEVDVVINLLADGRTEVHCPFRDLCDDCLYEARFIRPRG